jgi:hypothetical protein
MVYPLAFHVVLSNAHIAAVGIATGRMIRVRLSAVQNIFLLRSAQTPMQCATGSKEIGARI